MKFLGGSRRGDASGPYDRVVVLGEDGQPKETLSPEEFAKLGLDARVRLILGKRLRFFMGEAEVPLKDALRDHA